MCTGLLAELMLRVEINLELGFWVDISHITYELCTKDSHG